MRAPLDESLRHGSNAGHSSGVAQGQRSLNRCSGRDFQHEVCKYSVNPYLIEHNLININQLWRRSISALWMMVRRNRKEINELRLEATG